MIQREIERAGVATVSISLIREFTERIRPPRALWVPFPFGRPLGEPDNPAIQRRVILAALDLLERPAGPILEDFTLTEEEEYLDARWQTVGRRCSPQGCALDQDEEAPKPVAGYSGDLQAVKWEIEGLQPFYQRYLAAHGGRTQLGASGVRVDEIYLAAEVVHRFILGQDLGSLTARKSGVSPRYFVRLSIDDLKAFYLEAKLGESPEAGKSNAAELNDWLWLETCAGRMIMSARDRLVATTDPAEDPNWVIARGIVPRGYGSSGYGLGHMTD